MQILHDFYCDYYSPAEKRDIMRPGSAIAGTRDTQAEIRDIPGNTGLLATLPSLLLIYTCFDTSHYAGVSSNIGKVRKAREVFTTSQLDVLERSWKDGMTSVRTTADKDLVNSVATQLGVAKNKV
jgi:hypothetical protein